MSKIEIARDMAKGYMNSFPTVIGIPTEELISKLPDISTGNLILVDVRDNREQNISMIDGAITKDFFEEHYLKNPSYSFDQSESLVVVYCTVGYRSGLYCQLLMSRNIPCRNSEGIVVWTHFDQPLKVPGSANDSGYGTETISRIRRVHTYGAQWDLIADGYESVYFSTFEIGMIVLLSFFRGWLWQ